MVKTRVGRIPALSPNWSDPVVARHEFMTEIITSRNGDEQRLAHRQSARSQIGFSSLLKPGEWTRFSGDMAAGQNDSFFAAVPYRQATLDGVGSNTLTLNTMPFWMVTDALVIIEDETQQELATVLSVASPTVTLTGALTGSFSAGAKVYLAKEVVVEANVGARSPTSNVSQVGAQLLVKPGLTPDSFAAITPTQHNSIDVFTVKPNWSRPVETDFFTERGLYDADIGRFNTFDLAAYSTNTRKSQFSALSAAAAEEIVAFFMLKKGRRGSFYAPTYTNDMQALVAQASGSSELTVAGEDFFTAYDQHPLWNTVYVDADGTTQINTISSMATVSGNTVLTMADTWTMDIPADAPVSWCPLSRFATDVLAVNWLTDAVAEMALSFTAIRNIS